MDENVCVFFFLCLLVEDELDIENHRNLVYACWWEFISLFSGSLSNHEDG